MQTNKSKNVKKSKQNKILIKKRILPDGTVEITRYAHPWEYKDFDPEELYKDDSSEYENERERF